MDLQKEAAILEQKLDDAKLEGRQEGIQIGHEKGKIEGKIEVAKTYLRLAFLLMLFPRQLAFLKLTLHNLRKKLFSLLPSSSD